MDRDFDMAYLAALAAYNTFHELEYDMKIYNRDGQSVWTRGSTIPERYRNQALKHYNAGKCYHTECMTDDFEIDDFKIIPIITEGELQGFAVSNAPELFIKAMIQVFIKNVFGGTD